MISLFRRWKNKIDTPKQGNSNQPLGVGCVWSYLYILDEKVYRKRRELVEKDRLVRARLVNCNVIDIHMA